MRTERDIIENIMSVANADLNIMAVVRTNLIPVRRYLFAYEFYFIVNDISTYDNDKYFEKSFGDRILLYRSDKNYPDMFLDWKAHLMVFRDGVTIVVNIVSENTFLQIYEKNIQCESAWRGETYQIIVDKNNILPQIETLHETQTLFAQTPSKTEFDEICNEFWWVLKTFVEYNLREELLPTMFYLNISIRDLLNRMLRWYIFLQENQPIDIGILDSNMDKLLDNELLKLYKKTYPQADYDSIWNAYDAIVELWHRIGCTVAKQCGYDYPYEIEINMLEFICKLRMMKV